MQPTSFPKRTAYLATGGIGLFFAAAYLGMAGQLPFGPLERPGAGVFPVISGVVLMLASLITLLEGRQLDKHRQVDLPARAGRNRLLSLVSLLFGYFLALPWFGHMISSALFCALLMRLLSDRSWPRIAAYSLVISAVLYLVFVVSLKVPLPRGVLGI